jgi:deoxyribose-phosphate aldolase
MTPQDLARMIDHTALKPETTPAQIEQLCREALTFNFASVCVNPVFVSAASRLLEGSAVKTCTVVGFPLGATTTTAKTTEAKEAIRFGAREIDMVLWIGGLKAKQDEWVGSDIAALADVCREAGAILKVILECTLLTDDEKRRAAKMCVEAKAQFVKTSTGFAAGGATVDDVKLLSSIAKPAGLGVKAAGGIRTYEDARKMIEAGATRLGASAGVKIIEEAKAALRKG